MIRKILFFTMLMCAALSAHAQTNRYCISSEKLTDMRDQLPTLAADMQRAHNELFQLLLTRNETDSIDNAGCIHQQDLAQICKNTWGNNTERCETFIYSLMTVPKQGNFSPLEYSCQLQKTNFADIDPDTFHQAVNKAVARRRDKSIPSKLQDMGTVFLGQAQEKQINPFISAAISLYESSRGTSNLARTKNNIAGLGGPGRWLTFTSVPDSIATQAQVLHKNIGKGRTDLNKLACSGAYCATNTNPWFRNVSSIAKELYRYYNAIIQDKK